MHRCTARLQPRPDHRLSGPFAIGARDMDHRRHPAFGVAQQGQQTDHAAHGQINHLGVQRHHPLQNRVRRLRHALAAFGAGSASTGAGRSPFTAGGISINMRITVTSSSRIALRWVTRSNMP